MRFRLSAGLTVLGDIVVELFDQEKPVTVNNFLSYVRSEAYKNTILHRCQPGYVLQGGAVGVCNPFVGAPFYEGFLVETNAPIVNETYAGPLISNTFGTLAMATQEGNPNSGTASWFFNLSNTNATFLDTNNGGYCVFGRVTSGAALLSRFNTVFTAPAYFPATESCCLLANVPVPYPQAPYANYYPLYSDLFVVEITELTNGKRTDSAKPKVAITAPGPNSVFSTDTVTVSGTAADSSGIRSVDLYFVDPYSNLGCPMTANGTTSWSLTLTNPPPGTNLVIVQSTDGIGNRSAIAYRTFFQRAQTPIALTVEPPEGGTIVGASDGELLDVNRRYVLTPQPAPGYLFAGWTGSGEQSSGPLVFYMQTNFTFTATFVPNRFPLVKGVYNGLFFETGNVRPDRSGFITVTVGDSVGFSGKVQIEGRSYSIANLFTADGDALFFLDRRPFTPVVLLFIFGVNLESPDNMIAGEVRGSGGWTAELRAYRQVTDGTPFAAKHTLLLPGAQDAGASPPGDGFGTVSVDVRGKLTFSGTLADGTRAVQRLTLGSDGWWPVYAPLYARQGSLLGWVQFDPTQPTTDLTGLLTWSKPSQLTSRYYPNGFTNPVQLIGSRYFAPVAPTDSAMNFSTGHVALTGGDLAAPLTNHITVGLGGKIANDTPENKMTLTLARPTGLLKGRVAPSGGARPISFKGAWLQKSNIGGGFFLGTSQGGHVSIQPEDP